MKKIIAVALSVVFLVGVFAVVAPVQAASLGEIQKQIQSLLGQVKQMQAQNQSAAVFDAVSSDETTETSAPTTAAWCFTFKNNLRRGDAGRAVANLHIALMNDSGGPNISNPELAKKLFGVTTKTAVIDFQEKYKILPAEGFVGVMTRAQLNQLYGCGGTSSSSSSSSTWPSSSSSSSATPTTPSITILSPNGGEFWKKGGIYIVRWETHNAPINSWVALLTRLGSRIIAQGLPVEGSYAWTIPEDFESSGDYKIEARLYTGSNLCDINCPPNPEYPILYASDNSNDFFSIVDLTTPSRPSHLDLISPSAGPIGTKVKIVGDGFLVRESADINIIKFGPVAIVADPFPPFPSGGTITFTVPQSGPSSCSIDGVCAKDLIEIKPGVHSVKVINPLGESNSVNFEVTGVAPTPTPTITITAPNGGEKWQIGSMHTITWTPYEPACFGDQDFCTELGINPADSVIAHLEQLIPGINQFVGIGKIIEGGKASIHWDGVSLEDFSGNYLEAKPGDYYIRIVNNVTGASDRSDNAFKLMARDSVTADLKLNNSDGPIKVPAGGANYTASWTSNADLCSIYNGTLPSWPTEKLPPSGKITIKLMPNTDVFDKQILLSCISHSNLEGFAWDGVMVVPSGAPRFSATITSPNGGEFVDYGSPSQINYAATGVEKVSLALYKNNKFFAWIVRDMPVYTGTTSGGFSWQPSSIIPQDKIGKNVFKIYMIGKKSGARGTVTDKSDKSFTIVNMPKG